MNNREKDPMARKCSCGHDYGFHYPANNAWPNGDGCSQCWECKGFKMKKKKKQPKRLSKKELKLLLKVLEEAYENRSDMGCNDPESGEERLFTKKERIAIQKKYLTDEYEAEDLEEADGFMFNMDYVTYLIARVKEQK